MPGSSAASRGDLLRAGDHVVAVQARQPFDAVACQQWCGRHARAAVGVAHRQPRVATGESAPASASTSRRDALRPVVQQGRQRVDLDVPAAPADDRPDVQAARRGDRPPARLGRRDPPAAAPVHNRPERIAPEVRAAGAPRRSARAARGGLRRLRHARRPRPRAGTPRRRTAAGPALLRRGRRREEIARLAAEGARHPLPDRLPGALVRSRRGRRFGLDRYPELRDDSSPLPPRRVAGPAPDARAAGRGGAGGRRARPAAEVCPRARTGWSARSPCSSAVRPGATGRTARALARPTLEHQRGQRRRRRRGQGHAEHAVARRQEDVGAAGASHQRQAVGGHGRSPAHSRSGGSAAGFRRRSRARRTRSMASKRLRSRSLRRPPSSNTPATRVRVDDADLPPPRGTAQSAASRVGSSGCTRGRRAAPSRRATTAGPPSRHRPRAPRAQPIPRRPGLGHRARQPREGSFRRPTRPRCQRPFARNHAAGPLRGSRAGAKRSTSACTAPTMSGSATAPCRPRRLSSSSWKTQAAQRAEQVHKYSCEDHPP